MTKRLIYFLALAVWLLLFVVAFSLGAVRQLLIAPAIGVVVCRPGQRGRFRGQGF